MSTSGSRTAVVEQAGAKSQLASLVGAGIVVGVAAVLQLPAGRPSPVGLAAVLIAAALSLLDLEALAEYYRVRKSALRPFRRRQPGRDRARGPPGIVIAIVLAVALFFRRSWQPHGAVLGQVEGLAGWHNVGALPRRRRDSRGSSSTDGRRRCSSRTAPRSAPRSARSSDTPGLVGRSSNVRR